jgi:hypothetical protein
MRFIAPGVLVAGRPWCTRVVALLIDAAVALGGYRNYERVRAARRTRSELVGQQLLGPT